MSSRTTAATAAVAAVAGLAIVAMWHMRRRKRRSRSHGLNGDCIDKPTITDNRYLQLPPGTRVHMASSVVECDRLLAPLVHYAARLDRGQKQHAIGFDTEFCLKTTPAGRGHDDAADDKSDRRSNTVALVQLALPRDLSGDVVLIRLSHMGGALPSSLEALLASPSIVPVGVGVRQDLRLLEKQFPREAALVEGDGVDRSDGGNSVHGVGGGAMAVGGDSTAKKAAVVRGGTAWAGCFVELQAVALRQRCDDCGLGLRHLVERYLAGATL